MTPFRTVTSLDNFARQASGHFSVLVATDWGIQRVTCFGDLNDIYDEWPAEEYIAEFVPVSINLEYVRF